MITQAQAVGLVKVAIKNGTLIRADQCGTCNKKPTDYKTRSIVAHHWNGYDDPLNVWWVCQSCNRLLAHKHDGSLTKEQAKIYVRERQRATLGRRLNWFR